MVTDPSGAGKARCQECGRIFFLFDWDLETRDHARHDILEGGLYQGYKPCCFDCCPFFHFIRW